MTYHQIRTRHTGRILYEGEYASLRGCIEAAVHSGVSLAYVDLVGACLRNANLVGVRLWHADLGCADLAYANLGNVNLLGANLSNANLIRANLMCADLAQANFAGANLTGANLMGAYLQGAKGLAVDQIAHFSILPEGTLIGWKKLAGGVIAKLEIPAAAQRVNCITSRKCRAEYARVLALYGLDGAPWNGVGWSLWHDRPTRYVVGEIVRPVSFDPDPRTECSHGIHFYITRAEAEAH